ncbi:MAG: hypothetical protein Fur0042_07520 [Cyanophyceae cyanobacterium]
MAAQAAVIRAARLRPRVRRCRGADGVAFAVEFTDIRLILTAEFDLSGGRRVASGAAIAIAAQTPKIATVATNCIEPMDHSAGTDLGRDRAPWGHHWPSCWGG